MDRDAFIIFRESLDLGGSKVQRCQMVGEILLGDVKRDAFYHDFEA